MTGADEPDDRGADRAAEPEPPECQRAYEAYAAYEAYEVTELTTEELQIKTKAFGSLQFHYSHNHSQHFGTFRAFRMHFP